ncbi:MAG TPA: hypothetical protein VNI77_09090 [Nitrososphaera sp.]|nr:hypothetical protein [Nitrososphaera sp.]
MTSGGNEGSSSTRQVTLRSDTTLTAVKSAEVTLTIRSVALDGSPIIGLWTILSGAGSTSGFTALTYTVKAGSQT